MLLGTFVLNCNILVTLFNLCKRLMSSEFIWTRQAPIFGVINNKYDVIYSLVYYVEHLLQYSVDNFKVFILQLRIDKLWYQQWQHFGVIHILLKHIFKAFCPPPPPLCVEKGFTLTFPGNQDVDVKWKSEVIYVRFW